MRHDSKLSSSLRTPPWYPSDDRQIWTHRTPEEQIRHEQGIAKAQAITEQIRAHEQNCQCCRRQKGRT